MRETDEAPFSKGTLVAFRQRLINGQIDRRMIERTIEIVNQSQVFGPRALRAALDSSPLWGAGRVEEEGLVSPPEVVFSDIFEICLADRTKVRGCFALWKQTRHILALAFDYHMRADLVVKTINQVPFTVPGTIFHSDQGSQFGAEQTRAVLLEKGFIRSMSRAGTPTDNGHAERFVGTFKLAVAERRRYRTLGDFLQASENWINFYNHLRPHEGIGNCSPDQFAAHHGLPSVPYLPLL